MLPLQMDPPKTASSLDKRELFRLSAAFLVLGLINNTPYVVVLSAAQDLVPRDIAVGVVLFVNIFPSLCAKLGWPYLVRGTVRYAKRVVSCTCMTLSGMLLVAFSPSVGLRLLGIAIASFSSGLGEMTALQLSTTLDEVAASRAVGWFASGTGAAGICGALLWWILRGLGVRIGLAVCSAVPLGFSLAYFVILPRKALSDSQQKSEYTPVASGEEDLDDPSPIQTISTQALTLSTKLELAKPLVLPFMLPLFFVYMAEYTINQGVAPNLLYPIPVHGISSLLIQHLSDYYPLWQLIYQTFVFFSRSAGVLFGIPLLPRNLVFIPTIVQVLLLIVVATEASLGSLSSMFGSYILPVIMLLVATEGLSGGYSYVSMFSCVGTDDEEVRVDLGLDERKKRREFRIACVGFADTSGILAASLLSIWLQPYLCAQQVTRGKDLCELVKQG